MSAEPARFEYKAFTQFVPDVHAALLALGKATADGGLEQELTELVKLRVSQINGCAFCLQIHLNRARRLGVAQPKLDLLATWRDTGVFSEREAAALAWAERLTHVADGGVPDQAYAALREHFSEAESVLLTVAVGTINNWNRIGVALRFPPPIPT